MKKTEKGQPVLARGRAVVGIDIGKRKHAATALSPQGEIITQLASFPNTREGVELLENLVLRKAGGPRGVLLAMEATGHYWICLHAELQRRGYACVVLNAVQTNAKSNARIRKTRNDRIDSATIARLIFSGDAKPTRVPDQETTELRLLVRHRQRLVHVVADMERYAHTLVDRVFPEYADVFCKPFIPSGRKLIRHVGISPRKIVENEDYVRKLLHSTSRGKLAPETIDRLIQAARDSIGSRKAEDLVDRQLVSIFDYLRTVRKQIDEIEQELDSRMEKIDSPLLSLGIGKVLAAIIHAESDPIGDFRTPDQYVAYAGLDPSRHDSGDTLHRRKKISKRGSPLLRHAVYLAAFVTYRKHQYFHRIYRKHRRQGKNHTCSLVIVARHLARVIWRILTDGRPFTKRRPKNVLPTPNRPQIPK
jgi:transposase